jgi:hypothetical protein
MLSDLERRKRKLPQLALFKRALNPSAAGLVPQGALRHLKPLRRRAQAQYAALGRTLQIHAPLLPIDLSTIDLLEGLFLNAQRQG